MIKASDVGLNCKCMYRLINELTDLIKGLQRSFCYISKQNIIWIYYRVKHKL